MSVKRLHFALNNDDPDIVCKGLVEFESRILQEHESLVDFGYNGRSAYCSVKYIVYPRFPSDTQGVLASYIQSSPHLEELFVLWDLPGRDEDRVLSAHHTRCLASIIHCAHSNRSFCDRIVGRIINDHTKSIANQLSSGNNSLVHSTLGLLLSMCRTSYENCRDVNNKLLSIFYPTLSTLSQRGKAMNWENILWSDRPEEKESNVTQALTMEVGLSGVMNKLQTDARYLILLIMLRVLESADAVILAELHSDKSILKRLLHSVHKDVSAGVNLLLEGLQLVTSGEVVIDFFDYNFQQRLLELYDHDELLVRETVHNFMCHLCKSIAKAMDSGTGRREGRGYQNKASAGRVALQLLRALKGHLVPVHRELQSLLLASQPVYLPKCIASIILPCWTETNSLDQISAIVGAIAYLSRILVQTDIESASKTFVKAAILSDNIGWQGTGVDVLSSNASSLSKRESHSIAYSSSPSEERVQSFCNELIGSYFPAGLTKRELAKYLVHSSSLLQSTALELILAVLHRLHRLFGDLGKCPRVEALVSFALFRHIPEFQVLLSLRTKYTKEFKSKNRAQGLHSDSTSGVLVTKRKRRERDDRNSNRQSNSDSNINSDANSVSDSDSPSDNDSDRKSHRIVCDESEDEISPAITSNTDHYHLNLVLRAIEALSTTLPGHVHQTNFDMMRILDELIDWPQNASASEALNDLYALPTDLVNTTLRILTATTTAQQGRWFGSKEECVKTVTNLVFSADWAATIKRTALAKIMLMTTDNR